jgi:hypothetical protein
VYYNNFIGSGSKFFFFAINLLVYAYIFIHIDSLDNYTYTHEIVYVVSIYYLLYWFLSIFFFLIKKVYFNRFNSMYQRFWKQTLMLFWLIEIFLFSIYIFLTLNNPEESFYMLDHMQLSKQWFITIDTLLIKSCWQVLVGSLIFISLVNQKYSSPSLVYYMYICLWIFFLQEFYQFIYLNNLFYNPTQTQDVEDNLWNLETFALKYRSALLYLYILILLKFWHIVFIFFFAMFFLLTFINFNKVSYNWTASLFQNYLFLFVFNCIFLIFNLKFYFKSYAAAYYYWWYTNINAYYTYDNFFTYYHYMFLYL